MICPNTSKLFSNNFCCFFPFNSVFNTITLSSLALDLRTICSLLFSSFVFEVLSSLWIFYDQVIYLYTSSVGFKWTRNCLHVETFRIENRCSWNVDNAVHLCAAVKPCKHTTKLASGPLLQDSFSWVGNVSLVSSWWIVLCYLN